MTNQEFEAGKKKAHDSIVRACRSFTSLAHGDPDGGIELAWYTVSLMFGQMALWAQLNEAELATVCEPCGRPA